MQGAREEGEEIGEARGVALGEARGVALGEARGVALGEARGVALGEARGVALGEARGVRTAIETVCEVLDIDLTPDRHAQLGAMSLPELHERLAHIKRERCW